MSAYRPGAYEESICDFGIREPLGDESKDFNFASREASWKVTSFWLVNARLEGREKLE